MCAREVVYHTSAWDIDLEADPRVKMCIESTAEDFTTVHRELDHNFYQRAYKDQPVILRDSANDGFHEAIGDTITLSVTPEYLVKIGLLDHAPDASRDIGLLLDRGLERFAFLPFGLLIDRWRWKVFSGEIPATSYNKAWWDLRLEHQGVAPPALRGEEFFDPGAKYHVPDNTPYMRYFLARILQFQFHTALSKTAGCATPLHRCSIYESKGSRTPAERNDVPGDVASLARRARGGDWIPADGRHRHSRLSRAALEVARQTARRKTRGLVEVSAGSPGARASRPARTLPRRGLPRRSRFPFGVLFQGIISGLRKQLPRLFSNLDVSRIQS